MTRTTLLLTVSCWLGILGTTWVQPVLAGEPYLLRSWWSIHDPCCCPPSFGDCCDDYCRKPTPRIPCRVERCECDDYCRRPIPCVARPAVTCVDDYDCKPLPRLCWPRSPQTTCVPYCAHVSDSDASPIQTTTRPKILWIR